ncbi:MAG: RHS repeat domain-containing protein [Gemmataceae bacterium]
MEKRATDGGTLQMAATYVYDALGQRIEKQVMDGSTTVTRFTHDNGLVLFDLDGSSSLIDRYVLGARVLERLARIAANGDAAWLLADRLGSIFFVTDETGAILSAITYDAYGNKLSESSPTNSGDYGYASYRTDRETGLQKSDLSGRYYDAPTGRWYSEDRVRIDGPNLYDYVRNNPTNAIDPDGLQGVTDNERVAILFEAKRKLESSLTTAYYNRPDRLHPFLAGTRSAEVIERYIGNKAGVDKWISDAWHDLFVRKQVELGRRNGEDYVRVIDDRLVTQFMGGWIRRQEERIIDLQRNEKAKQVAAMDPFDRQILDMVRKSPVWEDMARSGIDHAAQQLMLHAALRDTYFKADTEISKTAERMVRAGIPEERAARWRVATRNKLKDEIIKKGNRLIEAWARRRPQGHKPTYEELRQKGKTDMQIIRSKPNQAVQRVAARLRVAGRILIAIDIAIGGYNVVSSGADWPKTLIRETGRIGGAITFGAAGAKLGAKAGGGLALLAGPEAVPIGAGVGAVVFGIGGAIIGGIAGETGAEYLIDELFPPDDTILEILETDK